MVNMQLPDISYKKLNSPSKISNYNSRISFGQKGQDSFESIVANKTTQSTSTLKSITGKIKDIITYPFEALLLRTEKEKANKHRLKVLDFDTRIKGHIQLYATAQKNKLNRVIDRKIADVNVILGDYKRTGDISSGAKTIQENIQDDKLKISILNYSDDVETSFIINKETNELISVSGMIDDTTSFEYWTKDDTLQIVKGIKKEEEGRIFAEYKFSYNGKNFTALDSNFITDGDKTFTQSRYELTNTGYSISYDLEKDAKNSEKCATKYDVLEDGRILAYESFAVDKTATKTTADKVYSIVNNKLITLKKKYVCYLDLFMNEQTSSKKTYILEKTVEQVEQLGKRVRI